MIAELRIHHIDSVKPPTQSHFKHDKIELGLGKDRQGRQGAEFEIGQRQTATRRLHRLKRLHQRRSETICHSDCTRSL